MENNDYHLDLFANSMIQYFNEVLIRKNYVSTTASFRKYSLKNGGDTEFSIQIGRRSDAACDEGSINPGLESSSFTEEDFETLIKYSQLWSLHLSDASIKGNRLIFKLNQQEAHCRVLKSILNVQNKYGVNFTIPQGVSISIREDESAAEDLTQLRLRLVKRTGDNLMSVVRIEDANNPIQLFLTTKSCRINDSGRNVLCGVVINAATGCKETTVTPEDYYNIQLSDMRAMSEHKYWESGNEQLLRDLADATVTMALMEVNPKHTVTLRMESSLDGPKGTMSKGAAFVLYNTARLSSVRRKFESQVNAGVYPPLPRFDDLDFSLLREKEEWIMTFDFLLEYPSMVKRVVEDLRRGVVSTHLLCRFLSDLCSVFSVYYRRVRILLEPRGHLIPLIHVRLQLLRAVEIVIHNALTLLDIKIIDKM